MLSDAPTSPHRCRRRAHRQAVAQPAQAPALLEAGRRLLDTQDLGTLSVAQLTRDAGMAVGSFYSRFEDKEAWFAELLRVTGDEVLADTAALLAGVRWQRACDARKVAMIVRHVVDIHRTHRGIFRAAHFDSARSQLYWPQLHAFGWRLADAVHQALCAHMRRVPRGSAGCASAWRCSWSTARWSTRYCTTPAR